MTQDIENALYARDVAAGRIKSHAQKRAEDASCRMQAGFPGVTLASIVCDHGKRRAGIRADGRVHWLPVGFYEPVSRLETKYAAMDSAMRHWQKLMDQAREAADGQA